MAQLKMKDYANAIMIEPPPNAWGLQTVKIGEAGLEPGYPVTQTGETVPAVVYGATANDVFYGILLDSADVGLDEAFTANDVATCMIAGSRGACWTWAKASVANLIVGTRMHQNTATPTKFLVVDETMKFESAGLVIEYSATSASDRPIKLVLSG